MAAAFRDVLVGKKPGSTWSSFPQRPPVRRRCCVCTPCHRELPLLPLMAHSQRPLPPRPGQAASNTPHCRHTLPLPQIVTISGAAGAVFSSGLLRRLDLRLYESCIHGREAATGGPTAAGGEWGAVKCSGGG